MSETICFGREDKLNFLMVFLFFAGGDASRTTIISMSVTSEVSSMVNEVEMEEGRSSEEFQLLEFIVEVKKFRGKYRNTS